MGYPPQPQGPYGQHQPQQPHGHSGPQQPYGYGQQPPTTPPPPQRNTGLILLLAIGLPLLLLAGCGAVVLVLADAGQERVERVVEGDPPDMIVPSRQPEASAPASDDAPTAEQPSEPAPDQQSTATIGGAITLQGTDPGLQVKVTVTNVVNPATPASDFMKPKAGNKLVALEVRLENVGQTVYSDAPVNGARVIDSEGQQFSTSLFRVQEGQSLNGSVTINAGDFRKGMIAFEVPEGATLAKFQFALNSGFADQKGEWTLS